MALINSTHKILFLTALVVTLFSVSCRKKDRPVTIVPPPISPYGQLTVKFSNEVDGNPISFGAINYTNLKGNRYEVDLLKYYVSYFTLVRDDNTEINMKNHKLINAKDTTTCSFTLDSIPNGNYTAVKFYLGVDSAHNHTGLQEGDLSPSYTMIWDWRTGYLFFKHEGWFIDDTGGRTLLVYHFGTDPYQTIINLPVTKFAISGDSHTMNLKFNLNALYASPILVDFNKNNVHESTLVTDLSWLSAMSLNFPHAFSFDKVN